MIGAIRACRLYTKSGATGTIVIDKAEGTESHNKCLRDIVPLLILSPTLPSHSGNYIRNHQPNERVREEGGRETDRSGGREREGKTTMCVSLYTLFLMLLLTITSLMRGKEEREREREMEKKENVFSLRCMLCTSLHGSL